MATTTSSTSATGSVDILSTLNKSGSGLALKSLTTSLVQAEIAPRQSIQNRKSSAADLSISALGQVRSALGTLQTAVTTLQTTPGIDATFSDSAAVGISVTDRSKLTEKVSSLDVAQIALPQVLEFTGFTAADASVGTGKLKVEFGSWTGTPANTFTQDSASMVHTLTIPQGATLTDVATTLNTLSGVHAQVIDKGDGTFSLAIAGETGESKAIRMTATEDVAAPGLAAFDTTTTNSTHQVQASTNALIKLDGVIVSRTTNTVTDLIPGATLTLNGATAGGSLTVARDKQTVNDNVGNLVSALNDARKLLGNLRARASEGAAAGALASDSNVAALSQQLDRMITSPILGYGSTAVHLADLGVQTNRDGTLMLTQSGFDAAYSADPTRFDALFQDRLSASSSGVTLSGKPQSSAATGAHSFVQDTANGTATFDGLTMKSIGVTGNSATYMVNGGDFTGLTVQAPITLAQSNISFGRSMLSSLTDFLKTALSSSGQISRSETQANTLKTQATDALAKLDTESTKLNDRFTQQFAAMETAVTKLKSTGTYLTNLMSMWTAKANGG